MHGVVCNPQVDRHSFDLGCDCWNLEVETICLEYI